jgi:hypothetical protein
MPRELGNRRHLAQMDLCELQGVIGLDNERQ